MVKHRVPNIVRGGVALPLDKTNYYLVRGRKHEQGGIDIGKNPRTGLEVEDGEVVHVSDKELRVFSAEPILGGVSPSQLVVRGVNPDKVFAAQERFKKVNGIKDDGTKAPFGTLKKLIFGADFNDIKTSDGRNYNPAYIERAYSSLKKSNLTKKQQAVVLANIIEESGGDPFALNKNSGKDYGTLQWVDRYPKSNETNPYKEIDNQMGYFLNTVNNLDDQVSWTHGGKGSGYQSRKDAYNDFNSEDIETINRGFVLGHVRPAGKHASAKNRIGVAEQIYDRIKRFGGDSDEDKYIKQKADSVIQAALHKSRTRKNVEVPLFDDPEYKDRLQTVYDVMIMTQSDTRNPNFNPGYNKADVANMAARRYYNMLKYPNKKTGPGCIFNATDCYGKEHRVSGNQTFKENPEKYGFTKIDIKDAKEGDIVQHIDNQTNTPIHAMILNDSKDKNNLKFNYVRGGDEHDPIVINGSYPLYRGDTFDAYRFVGSPQDSIKWKNEYYRVNTKRFGGNKPYTTKLNPKEEFEFRQWYKKLADKKGLNPDYDAEEHYYDYRGFWKNEDRDAILNEDPNVHFIDKYKKPGHPTFSNESIYSKGNTIGGDWVQDKNGNWLFNHSEYTKQYKNRTKDYLKGSGEGYIIDRDTVIDKKRFGGDMKYKLVEVNIGGNSKLIRVAKPSSTGESERSEGLTRKRAAIGTKTRKLEDGTIIPIYDSVINPIDTPNAIKQFNDNIKPDLSLPKINITTPKIKLNGKQKLYKLVGDIINTPNLVPDVIGVGSNIIGSLITKRINNKALNNLTFQKPPVALMPSKLKTKININPQLDKMRESLADYERLISGNTASSRVALGRINRVRNQSIANTNELYGQKENMETQLINQDAMNQQRVLDRNLQQDYQYRAAKNAFENEVHNLKAENKVANVQNIVTGIQDLLTRREQRNMFNKTLTAETLANPNLPAEMYLKSGIWSKELYDMYRSQYPRKA